MLKKIKLVVSTLLLQTAVFSCVEEKTLLTPDIESAINTKMENATTCPPSKGRGKATTKDIKSSLFSYKYIQYDPFQAKDNEKLPLIIALHGNGEGAEIMKEIRGLGRAADHYKFRVLYFEGMQRDPMALNRPAFWVFNAKTKNVKDLENFAKLQSTIINSVVQDLQKNGMINDQVYLTGFSGGALFVHWIFFNDIPLRKNIKSFAAVEGLCPELAYSKKLSLSPKPFLMINGGGAGMVDSQRGGHNNALSSDKTFNRLVEANTKIVPKSLWDKLNRMGWPVKPGSIYDPKFSVTKPDFLNRVSKVDFRAELIEYNTTTNNSSNRVQLIYVPKLGHQWPGQCTIEYPGYSLGTNWDGFDASNIICQFFKNGGLNTSTTSFTGGCGQPNYEKCVFSLP